MVKDKSGESEELPIKSALAIIFLSIPYQETKEYSQMQASNRESVILFQWNTSPQEVNHTSW